MSSISDSISPGAAPSAAPGAAPPRRWLGRLHIHGDFWYRFNLWGAKTLPQWIFPALALIGTAIAFVLLRRIRTNIAANLEAVLGPCGFWERQRRAWRTLRIFAWCHHERYESLGAFFEIEAELVEGHHWEALEQGEAGYLLVTAHLGHWEAASFKPSTQGKNRPVHIVREGEINPAAQELLAQLLAHRGLNQCTVHFARPDGLLGPQLLFALRRGDVVALQGDRPAKGGRVAAVQLFGRPFAMPLGPLVLARSADVPLLPIFSYRVGRRQTRLFFESPIRVAKTGDRDQDLEQAARALAAMIEAAIRRDPYQWFCFQRLWPESSGPEL